MTKLWPQPYEVGDLVEVQSNILWHMRLGQVGCRIKSTCLLIEELGFRHSGYYRAWNLTEQKKLVIREADILCRFSYSGI